MTILPFTIKHICPPNYNYHNVQIKDHLVLGNCQSAVLTCSFRVRYDTNMFLAGLVRFTQVLCVTWQSHTFALTVECCKCIQPFKATNLLHFPYDSSVLAFKVTQLKQLVLQTHSNPALILLGVLDDGHGVFILVCWFLQPGLQGLLVPFQLTLQFLKLLSGFKDAVLWKYWQNYIRIRIMFLSNKIKVFKTSSFWRTCIYLINTV